MKSPDPAPEESERRPRNNLAVLGFVAVMLVGGWFLVQKLSALSKTQDCLMSGRSNCAPIDVPTQ